MSAEPPEENFAGGFFLPVTWRGNAPGKTTVN